MPNDFQPQVGQAFTLTATPRRGFDGVIHCRVLELDAPRLMRWSWSSGSMISTVTFELTPLASGTKLILTQDGFEGIGALVPWAFMRQGWRKKLRIKIPYLLGTESSLAAGS